MRHHFLIGALAIIALEVVGFWLFPWFLWSLLLFAPMLLFGFIDYFQRSHTIRRNFPLFGRIRYLFEAIRPEINQYFVESNTGGTPFSREQRSIVYQRSKCALDTLPFGTQRDVYQEGYEWVNHSLATTHVDPSSLRATIGGPDCQQPYDASLLNISAMSYGSLSKNAVLALNGGAKDGGFAHNTGEGGMSPYHQQPGGDLIWQIGTGYFGCRTGDGSFNADMFAEKSVRPQVKMIEIKISQGAKPGHGGILPTLKVTEEISQIRSVPLGKDVISPSTHSAFSTPVGLMEFVGRLRQLSDGKPIGFKLCIGKRREFLALCKAMVKTGITPDFVTIDGGEGGTGAAPLEFSNHVGSPGIESLIFAHNALIGFGVRDKIRVITTGKITTAFGMIRRLALGADLMYSARGMMLALGCIQALRCNANVCPAGVATQDPELVVGLAPEKKRVRVKNFHAETIISLAELLGAMGLSSAEDLRPWHMMRRIDNCTIRHYGELYEYLESGDLLGDPLPETFARAHQAASAETFAYTNS
jgi:glutamate synthase domain-containing protein 2